MSNTETVKAIYEAFGRGDVATILDKLTLAWPSMVASSRCGDSARAAGEIPTDVGDALGGYS